MSVAAILSLALHGTAFAQSGWYLAPEASYFYPDQAAYEDDDVSLGFAAGLTPAADTRIELGYYALRLIPEGLRGIVDQKNLQVTAYQHFRVGRRISPYISGGLGAARVDFNGVSTRPFATLGTGASWQPLSTWKLRLDVELRARYLHDESEALGDTGLVDGQALLKVRYHFGAAQGAEVEPRGQPRPAPHAPPHPVDDADGDGVVDTQDKCPNTIPNVQVDADGCMVNH